jgi:hypothetical protein
LQVKCRYRKRRAKKLLPKRKSSTSPHDTSQKKLSLKMPAPKSLKSNDVPDVIELEGEEEGNDEQYYENTAFLGIDYSTHTIMWRT